MRTIFYYFQSNVCSLERVTWRMIEDTDYPAIIREVNGPKPSIEFVLRAVRMPLLEAVKRVRLEVPIEFVREERHDAPEVSEPRQVCHPVEAQVVPLSAALGHSIECALCDPRGHHPVLVAMEVPVLQMGQVQVT